MGLAEKRALKAFQEGAYQELEKKIHETAGKKLDIEVKWDTLMEDGMGHLYEESFPKVYFNPLIKALESICADDMGKEAIAESLDKVMIKNEDDIHFYGKWSSFDNKVLTLDHRPTTNIDAVNDRASAVQKLLEDNL